MRTTRLRKDACTTIETPVFTVLHLSDPSVGVKPVVLGETTWFSEREATEYAREMSRAHPAPQRFAAYDPYGSYLSSWQTGKSRAAFSTSQPA